MKLLLADDHALFREGFALLVQQQGAHVECLVAAELDTALVLLEQHPDVDLLLLDFNMPGMGSLEAVAAVQRAHLGLPVCILSGEESRELISRLLAAGVAGFIPKSSSPQVMMSALQLILAGGVYVPPLMVQSLGETRSAPMPNPADVLTQRQNEILALLAQGKSNKIICRELNLSEGTVKTHLNALYRALGVENRTEAAHKARQLGLV
jgi:DNA-binding NarL/FixJ family response regulator